MVIEEEKTMRNIKIYQTNHRDFRFLEYEHFMEQAGFVDQYSLGYREVHSSQLDLHSNDMVACEQIYILFNINIPEYYKARPLNVSDIIVLDGKAYFVNSVGYMYLDPKETSNKLFGKSFYKVNQDSYYHEAIELFAETRIDVVDLDLENSNVVSKIEFDSIHGITLRLGIKKINEKYINVVTFYSFETSKNAYRLTCEFCAALAYEFSKYIESYNSISSAA